MEESVEQQGGTYRDPATGLLLIQAQVAGPLGKAAWVSFGVGGGLTALGALAMMAPQPQNVPSGPLPTFLRQLGVQAL